MDMTYKLYNNKGKWDDFIPDEHKKYEWITTVYMNQNLVITYLKPLKNVVISHGT